MTFDPIALYPWIALFGAILSVVYWLLRIAML